MPSRIAVASVRGSRAAVLADREVAVEVGPEVLAGSTRLKAGTAQKLVLDTISTVTMIRLGRTYGGLMVGVAPGNEKLRERARRNVVLASGASEERVDQALEAAAGDARVALVSLLAGIDADAARSRLEALGRLGPEGCGLVKLGSKRRSFAASSSPATSRSRTGSSWRSVWPRGPRGRVAVPGFVDLQVNGYAGVDFLSASSDDYRRAGEALLLAGVTAYQPTFITSAEETTIEALRAMPRGVPGPRVLGAHVEGPFLSPHRPGTHPLVHLPRAGCRAARPTA